MPEQRSDPTRVLTPFQVRFLKAFFADPHWSPKFFLTGGTALSAFHLQHRVSEDLDLFTRDEDALELAATFVPRFAGSAGCALISRRRSRTLQEYEITAPGTEQPLRVDLVLESADQIEPPAQWEGVRYDSLVDIAVNKVHYLDRTFDEPKNYVDLYFVLTETELSYEALRSLLDRKQIGFDEYGFARRIRRVTELGVLPKMLRPLDPEAMAAFFLDLSDEVLSRYGPPDAEAPDPSSRR